MSETRKGKNVPTPKLAVAAAKEYNPYLDVLKGFAILLVVFGHSIQNYLPSAVYEQNIIFRTIYSFHIPLFIFLAGAAAAYSSRPMNFEFLKRKFYMLVIPFVSWAALEYLISPGVHNVPFITYMHHVLLYPDYGLWFLWVLFLIFCVLAVAKKLYRWLKLYSYLVVWLAVYSIPHNTYGIGLVKWHFPFFVAGYLIFTHRTRLEKYQTAVLALCVIAAPILIASWHRLILPLHITGLEPRLAAHSLLNLPIGEIASINTYRIAVLIYEYAVPFAAIGAVFWLFQLKPAKHLWRLLGFIGLYTIDIYAIALSTSLLERFGFGSGWVRITTAFILTTAAAMAIGKFVLRPVPLLSFVFLGGRSTPKALTLKK